MTGKKIIEREQDERTRRGETSRRRRGRGAQLGTERKGEATTEYSRGRPHRPNKPANFPFKLPAGSPCGSIITSVQHHFLGLRQHHDTPFFRNTQTLCNLFTLPHPRISPGYLTWFIMPGHPRFRDFRSCLYSAADVLPRLRLLHGR